MVPPRVFYVRMLYLVERVAAVRQGEEEWVGVTEWEENQNTWHH